MVARATLLPKPLQRTVYLEGLDMPNVLYTSILACLACLSSVVQAVRQEIHVSKNTPAKQVNTLKIGDIWVSRWDNPTVEGSFKFLNKDQFTERKEDAWLYQQ